MLGNEGEICNLRVLVLNIDLYGFSMAMNFAYRPNSSASYRLMECRFIGLQNGVKMKTDYDYGIL